MDPGDIDLSGLIDLHMHTAPDVTQRSCDDLQAARLARDAGMRAILIKSHHTLTADRAAMAEKATGGVAVFGGMALNDAVGGLNPAAVEAALRMGCREVWMPTRSAAHLRRQEGQPGGLSPFTPDGSPLAAVQEILALIRDADAVLGTGHLSPSETVRLVGLARQRGLRKILITHPEAPFLGMDLATQGEMAGDGVFFEHCYLFCAAPLDGAAPLAEVAARIRAVGVRSVVLATDLGKPQYPLPVDGFRAYLAGLMGEGFTPAEIRTMAGHNPSALLGIG